MGHCAFVLRLTATRGRIRFFIRQRTGTNVGRKKNVNSIIGKLRLSQKQALILDLKAYQRISPYLIECCLRASANVAYENAAYPSWLADGHISIKVKCYVAQ